MTRFSRATLMGITLLASLTAAACQSDERTPTAPAVGPSLSGPAARGIAPVIGGGSSPSLSWTGADGHQYSVVMAGDVSRHFQDGVEYGDISGNEAVFIDGGAIINDQLLGSGGAGPMGVRGGGQLEDEHAPARFQPRPQQQMVASCAAEISAYIDASVALITAAAYFKASRSIRAKASFSFALLTWAGAWRALYTCEGGI